MKKALKNGGFSLIELLVVIAIFLVITGVVLFNQNKFSSDISISNVAYAIALQVRQAQVYGTIVRSSTSTTAFNSGYGVHLYNVGTAAAPKGAFKIFIDNNNDYQYNTGDTDVSSFSLAQGNAISEVCTYTTIGAATGKCFDGGSGNLITKADIVFKRPDPAAIMSDDDPLSGTPPNQVKRPELHIIVKSALGDKTRTIKVTSTGQISVLSS